MYLVTLACLFQLFQVPEFQQENYTENFIQCTLDGGLGNKKKGAVLVVGGDGRYLCPETVNLIIQMSAANGVLLSFFVVILVPVF